MAFERSQLEERKGCPICGSASRALRYNLDGFRIVRCDECSFQYVLDVAGAGANAAYYEDGYSGERHRQGQEVNASINVGMLRELGDLRGKRLLDVGSGFGFLPARARDDLGMIAEGVELSLFEREVAEKELGVTTHASLDALPAGVTYDMITLFEVIEHVLDPKELLAIVRDRLAPDGVLMIGTDNFDAAAVRAMADGFPKWIPNQHISLFNPATLRKVPDGMGFFRSFSYTPWEYWARVAVIRLTGGRKGKKNFTLADELATEDTRGYKFFKLRKAINALYAGFTRSNNLNGAMMYAVFRKV